MTNKERVPWERTAAALEHPEDDFIALVGAKGEAWIAEMLSSACSVHADSEGITEDEYNRWMELSQEADSLMVGIRTLLADEKARGEREARRPVKRPRVKTLQVTSDDETFESTVEEFIGANQFDENMPELAKQIRALGVGQSLTEGGGAAPEWRVERIS